MDEKEYRKLVIDLRVHQDAWFRLHNRADLIVSKQLEKLLDAENRRWQYEQIGALTEPTEEQLQLDLNNAIAGRRLRYDDAGDLLDTSAE